MSKQLLVYGSLRRGETAHKALDGCKYRKTVRLSGFDMHALGWFPGIVENPDNKEGIVGEIYEVPTRLEKDLTERLDYYEGYFPKNPERSLFVRREVEVNGTPTTIYVYNGRKGALPAEAIPSGDWSKRL